MALFIASFVAGALTILAPCILPLLPITLGGSVSGPRERYRPLVIIASLAASVFAFTLLLKGSTAVIAVSPSVWSYVSALILVAFGLTLLFPVAWAKIVLKLPGHRAPEAWMASGYARRGSFWGDALIGAALGPVFTTCSPTYFLIIATVLPQSLSAGIADLLAYILGLSLALLAVAYIGQTFVDKLGWATDPSGSFRKALGALFVIVGIAIAFGGDKAIEAKILDSGFFDVTKLESGIREALEGAPRSPSTPSSEHATSSSSSSGASPKDAPASPSQRALEIIPGEKDGGRYTEIADPSGFVNAAPFKLADLIGRKVILLDFIDYSCINCERTFPYMRDWYSKYKDQGLEIVAIHTPEFSFEKDKANVEAAAKQFGLEFPIVLDNEYATWNAYTNSYWPHKYVIDIHGNVVYEHVGEGNYDETEREIVKQLTIRREVLGMAGAVARATSSMPLYAIQAESPETYLGALRNERFGNGTPGRVGTDTFTMPAAIGGNGFYLGGAWRIDREYAESASASSSVAYSFTAAGLYIVAETADGKPVEAHVLIDGSPVAPNRAGADVKDGVVLIEGSRLYRLFSAPTAERHRIDIIFSKPGARLYTFTFG